MRKQFLAIVLAVCFALTALAGCGDKEDVLVIDPYEGTASATEYATERAAEEGYLEEELGCFSSANAFVNATRQEELTEEELDLLTLTDEERASVRSGFPVDLCYKIAGVELHRSIYLLETENGYKYFAPLARLNESVTRSELEKLIKDIRKVSLEVTADLTANGVTVNASASAVLNVKDGAVYIDASGKAKTNGGTSIYDLEIPETFAARIYAELSEEAPVAVLETELDGETEILDLLEELSSQPVDPLPSGGFEFAIDSFFSVYDLALYGNMFYRTVGGIEINVPLLGRIFGELTNEQGTFSLGESSYLRMVIKDGEFVGVQYAFDLTVDGDTVSSKGSATVSPTADDFILSEGIRDYLAGKAA